MFISTQIFIATQTSISAYISYKLAYPDPIKPKFDEEYVKANDSTETETR